MSPDRQNLQLQKELSSKTNPTPIQHLNEHAIKEVLSPAEAVENTCKAQRKNADLETPMNSESPEFKVKVSNFENPG